MSHYYRIEEAEAVLPAVEAALERGIELKSNMESAEQGLDQVKQRIHMLGGSMVNRDHVVGLKEKRDAAALELSETLERIQNFGCQVKDLDIGLIDFPTLYHDEEVLLCWRLGEPAILFWHDLTEGFQGRKMIDDEFRKNHRGSAHV